jgi:biopolymer transport protein ExbD
VPKRGHGRRNKEVPELNITAFLNLMVVLVPFLLITAAFSQITILQLNLPAAASASQSHKRKIKLEVVIRPNRLEIGDGYRMIKRIRNTADGYDIPTLSKVLLELKKRFPNKRNATVLVEPEIQYDVLVKVMDAVGSAEVVNGLNAENVELFPEISIGDAPKSRKG